MRPLRLEPLPLAAQPLLQRLRQPVVGLKQLINLLRRDLALHSHAVELAGLALELASAVFIQRERLRFTAINGDHIDLNIPQRNVMDRLELALDVQNPALRTLRNRRKKVVISAADYGAGVTQFDHPLHAHQRRHVGGVADLVGGLAEPAFKLLTVKRQGVREAV
ncbi:hypothetical protein D3C85_832680 [compost metagenome]